MKIIQLFKPTAKNQFQLFIGSFFLSRFLRLEVQQSLSTYLIALNLDNKDLLMMNDSEKELQ